MHAQLPLSIPLTCRQCQQAPPVLVLPKLLGCQRLHGLVYDALIVIRHLTGDRKVRCATWYGRTMSYA